MRPSAAARAQKRRSRGRAFGFEHDKRVKGIEACGPQTLAALGRRPRSGPPARKSDEAEGLAFGFEHGKRVKGIEPSTSTLAR